MPWMPNPLFTLASFFPSVYAAFFRSKSVTPDFTIPVFLIECLALLLLMSLLVYGTLTTVYRVIARQKSTRTQFLLYLLGIFCTAFSSVRVWRIVNPLETLTDIQLISRAFVMFYTYNLVWGLIQRRANIDASQMRALSERLLDQQKLLIDSDEMARAEVAEYLHNNVQTGLVVIGLQLRAVAAGQDIDTRARINSTIDELENIRLNEIRSASRRLTPNLEMIPLEQALKELKSSYGTSIKVKLNLDSQISEISPVVGMAIYRISEQALLNASVHAHATMCHISALIGIGRKVELKITNDGSALSKEKLIRGRGFAVIDAWVSRCDGSWKIYSEGSTQTSLSAVL
jgi:glucose-6-phosphate-specific signal transduction histidine kinase